ncbi:unnamed protein product [Rotaria socialis]|uniref:Transmembrane protein n=1 Tax=Rotaria socialis TaxID=392032 RepID=A0A817WWF0_9BILA|nr:unnamed protein product [Rotaria socialis]CAF4744249.1 unnamed protein product [Rotaria socialis]
MLLFRPTGHFAYAFTQQFLLLYNLDTDNVSMQLGNVTWPDTSFLPHAVDISDEFIVVLGFVGDQSTNYTPCAFLLNISNSTLKVLDRWLYTPPTNRSWQASLTNWDAGTYSARYDMSVSINPTGGQVLLGIQITNTIVLLNIGRSTNKFIVPPQSISNGQAIGMGKAVGWFDAHTSVVLVNTYSLSYIWSGSQVFVYDMALFNSSGIISVFPNAQQPLATGFGPILITLVVTETGTVAMLDSQGKFFIIFSSAAGSYADTSLGTFSSPLDCIGGTFNSQLSIGPCILCPQGNSTNGLTGQPICMPCAIDAFCPTGAAFGNISTSSSILTSTNQAFAYPVSPQSVRFDNILMQNMFYIRSPMSGHCVLVSAFFWALIVTVLGIVIVFSLAILKCCVNNTQLKVTRKRVTRFFKQTDIIGEGELWVGGIATFAILVVAIFAYAFSSAYFQRYPIEQVNSPANFACDTTLTNAQFSSGLMSLTIAPNDDEVPMFNLLNAQKFTVHLDLINTLFTCSDNVILMQNRRAGQFLIASTCVENNGSLSISAVLPSHTINLQLSLTGIEIIGGFRFGLTGPGAQQEDDRLDGIYKLVDLDFSQAFSVSGRILSHQPSFAVQLSKLMNRTYPLDENDATEFSAIWTAYTSYDIDQNFIDENDYKYVTSLGTTVTVSISEASYYISNTQRPITDQAELIFTDLLFTIVCVEIFGLLFLIVRLIIIPLAKRLCHCCRRRTVAKELPENGAEKIYDRF